MNLKSAWKALPRVNWGVCVNYPSGLKTELLMADAQPLKYMGCLDVKKISPSKDVGIRTTSAQLGNDITRLRLLKLGSRGRGTVQVRENNIHICWPLQTRKEEYVRDNWLYQQKCTS